MLDLILSILALIVFISFNTYVIYKLHDVPQYYCNFYTMNGDKVIIDKIKNYYLISNLLIFLLTIKPYITITLLNGYILLPVTIIGILSFLLMNISFDYKLKISRKSVNKYKFHLFVAGLFQIFCLIFIGVICIRVLYATLPLIVLSLILPKKVEYLKDKDNYIQQVGMVLATIIAMIMMSIIYLI